MSKEKEEDLQKLEFQAASNLKELDNNAEQLAETAAADFEKNLAESDLIPEEQKKAKETFAATVLRGIREQASNALKEHGSRLLEDLKQSKGPIYNLLASSERFVNFLESVKEFKDKLDKILPISSDKILEMAASAIIGLTASYSPAIAAVLKSEQIIEKAANFLETDNLKKTIDGLKETLEKNKNDKELSFITKTIKFVKETGVSAESIKTFARDSKMLDHIADEVKKNPKTKEFMEVVSSFADQTLPKNEKEIDKTMKEIKSTVIRALDDAGAPRDLIEKVNERISKDFAKAKEIQMKTLDNPKAKLFDKVQAGAESAKIIMECISGVAKDVNKNMNKEIITSAITKKIEGRVQGKLAEVTTHLKDPRLQEFAKKSLGAGIANLTKIAQSVQEPSKVAQR